MCTGLYAKCRLLLADFVKLEISRHTEIPNFMKIHPVGAELLNEDRQTDRQTDRETDKQTD